MSDDKPTLDELLTEIPEIRQWMQLLLAANGPDTLSVKHFTEALALIDALLAEHSRLTAALDEAQRVTRIEYNNEGMATPLDIPPGATITKIDMTWNVEDTPDAGEGSDE